MAWNETCYCPTPLLEERAAVYDRFFEGMETEEAEEAPPPEGESFWSRLSGGPRLAAEGG